MGDATIVNEISTGEHLIPQPSSSQQFLSPGSLPDRNSLDRLLTFLKHDGQEGAVALGGQMGDTDWQALAVYAKRVGLAQVLFHRVQALTIPLPDGVTEQLQQNFYWTAARNLRFSRQVAELVREFSQHNIPVVLLKGAYLVDHVYENIALRSMADIDLLIPRESIPAAIEIARGAGFMPDRSFLDDADGVLHYHAPPVHRNDLVIELHWSLTRESNLSTINVEDLWARARGIDLNGIGALALCPEDLLAHLAVHAAYGHRFHNQLRSVYDIEVVLQKFGPQLDWQAFLERCRQWQAERGVYLALQLLVDLFASPVPENVLVELRPADYTLKAKEAALASLLELNPVMSENFVRLMHGSSLSERVSGLWNGLFPRREVVAMELNLPPRSWRIWPAYPVHVFRSIRKYWRHAWRLLLGNKRAVSGDLARMTVNKYLKVG